MKELPKLKWRAFQTKMTYCCQSGLSRPHLWARLICAPGGSGLAFAASGWSGLPGVACITIKVTSEIASSVGINQNGPIDYLCSFLATLGVAIPNFVLGIFFIVVFVIGLHWLPDAGGWKRPADWPLPALALGLGPLGILARYTRSSMVEVLRQDYIRTANAKGLAFRKVVTGHAVKNGLLAPLTILGPMFAAIGTGSFFVETIFQVPGMGQFFVTSMVGRDYPVIMAVILLYGIFLAVMNLIVDLFYGVVDPRIRFE